MRSVHHAGLGTVHVLPCRSLGARRKIVVLALVCAPDTEQVAYRVRVCVRTAVDTDWRHPENPGQRRNQARGDNCDARPMSAAPQRRALS